jgi:hypothetical protein
MFSNIASEISDWAIHLVFSPKVWLGVILAGVSVALFFLSGFMRNRGVGGGTPRRTEDSAAGKPRPRALPKAKQAPGPLDDDGLDDEIAAILKRRGIS